VRSRNHCWSGNATMRSGWTVQLKITVNNIKKLTLILLTCRIGWAPNNVSKWQMGFHSTFKLPRITYKLFLRQIQVSSFFFSGATALQGLGRQSGRRRSAKLVPTFADRGVSRGQRNGSPTAVNLCLPNQDRYLFYSSSSSIDLTRLTRLSVPRSRPTVTQKIW